MEKPMITKTSSTDNLRAAWRKAVAKYQKPDRNRSLWMLVNSLGGYLILWTLMAFSLSWSYWLTLLLAVPTAGFMVRIFIIFHDCGHGSFFKSTRTNTLVGILTGLFTFTPYHQWRHHHAIHHATAGNLDKRGTGDVLTLTVKEYLALPWIKRLGYRLYRNPLVMFVLGPAFVFLIGHRIPSPKIGRRERQGVWWTNLALLGIFTESQPAARIQKRIADPAPDRHDWHRRRCVVVLRPAPVRGRLLGAARKLGIRQSRFLRQFLLPLAQAAAVVQRKYRFPPCASSQPAHT